MIKFDSREAAKARARELSSHCHGDTFSVYYVREHYVLVNGVPDPVPTGMKLIFRAPERAE